MDRGRRELTRACAAVLASAPVLAAAVPAVAQDRLRVSVNAGPQTTSTSFAEEQTFQQYLEQGSFAFERTVPKALFYDAGAAVRLWRGRRWDEWTKAAS